MTIDPKTTITLQTVPPYVIDFKKYKQVPQEQAQLQARVMGVVTFPIKATTVFFQALIEANWSSLTHMRISFFQNVLGYYGPLEKFRPPEDLHLAVFKTAIWVLATAWYTTERAVDLFSHKMWGAQQIQWQRRDLERFNPEMDMSHMRSGQKVLDASRVPAEIQVGTLLAIFDNINFTDENAPGYMASTSRKEGSITYTLEELRTSLEKFINNVNGRVAFLGTPPAHDTPKLMRFYQHIEDATRLSIHKVREDLRSFQEKYGTDVGSYEQEQMNAYKNLLENQARAALDLAIAGKHCGGRYMGDATVLYNNCYAEEAIEAETLEDVLIELLAKRRGEIARGHIEKHLGTDTHGFSAYMAALGSMLGIPGSENVVEHLKQLNSKEKYLRYFFETYTTDDIIKTVNDHIKTSGTFLDKIQAWIRDAGMEGWKPQGFDQTVKEALGKVQEAMQNSAAGEGEMVADFNRLCNLLTHLRGAKGDDRYLSNTTGPDLIVKTFCYLKGVMHPDLQQKNIDLTKTRDAVCTYLTDNRNDLVKLPQTDFFARVFADIEPLLVEGAAEEEQFDLPSLAPVLGYMKYEQNKGGTELPWQPFWEELFSLNSTNEHLKTAISDVNARLLMKTRLKTLCSQGNLGKELFEEFSAALLEGRALDVTRYQTRLEHLDLVRKIQLSVPKLQLEQEVVMRAIDQDGGVQQLVEERMELTARQDFIDAIELIEMKENGLSPQIMEWLLVSHRIFLPQNMTEVSA